MLATRNCFRNESNSTEKYIQLSNYTGLEIRILQLPENQI